MTYEMLRQKITFRHLAHFFDRYPSRLRRGTLKFRGLRHTMFHV